MASIYLPVFRAKDSNGVIVSGAGLWVYATGTTTPADIFTDDARTTPASNPLTSDSAGYFAQFFIASSTTVDLQCRADADDNTSTLLWQALKIDSLGAEDVATFIRDFGDDGRVQFVGRDSQINLEFGDPDGDDIGGTGRIGGWAGTQADTIEVDAAQTNVTGDVDVTGDLEFGGVGPVNKIIATETRTTAATQDIELPTGYDCYELELIDFKPSTGVSLYLLLAFDDVPTFKTGASDYAWQYETQAAATASGGLDIQDALIAIGGLAVPATGVSNHLKMTIISGASRETTLTGDMTSWNSSYGKIKTWFDAVTRARSYGKATYIRFYTNTGTIAFKYVLRGLRQL